MAKAASKTSTRKPRTPKVYANEEAVKTKIATLAKAAGDEPSETQKEQLKALRAELGGMKFLRLAGARVGKALAIFANIGKLGTPQYKRTPAQVKFIVDALENGVAEVKARLAATSSEKAAKQAFVIPASE